MTTTLRQLCDKAQRSLSPHYGVGEARWLVRIIMEQLKGYSTVDIALKADMEVTQWLENEVARVVARLLDDEPVQYIFSDTRFYGLKLKVTPSTLIPRPETEEMVDMIVKQSGASSDLRVLDACTGSGCIALALSRHLPFSRVDAFDISEAALAVARENASSLRADVRFFNADALHLATESRAVYDIIVSNPPYIAMSESAGMEPNVLRYEPRQALFVPDADPLCFYISIARYAMTALKPGGSLWFEINPLFAGELAGIVREQGWEDVSVLPDMQRKKRFLTAKLPSE